MEDHEVFSVDVGARLRQLRQERGKSMRSLARASGLSTNALSMIERARTSPSVSTLQKIAQALNIPITAFFRTEPPRQDVVYRQADVQKGLVFDQGEMRRYGGEMYNGSVDPFLLTLAPGAGSGGHDRMHTGHEFLYCLEGQVDFTVDNQVYHLQAGDSLIFSAQIRHRWHNSGQVEARVLFVLSGFEPGERPSEFHI